MKIIDISMPLNKNTAEWPGDTPFTYKVNWTKEESGSVNVGCIETSTHIGTHVDAPFHFDDHAPRIHQMELDRYVGKALVVNCQGLKSVGAEHLENIDLSDVTIVLLKTMSWNDRSHFPENITYLEPSLGPMLQKNGVRLVGVDTPSVDPVDSKELGAHHSLWEHDVAILEGLVLNDVETKVYECIALPLRIEGADGSPVRAILREI
ncbi:arylformamidase [Bacillus carboniphilus]|uniref:Kynurenine formamidase n=1 Tax=Bacillus carboniphilus TaxID=86663 RepID=A0ABN0W7R5_9BACI